MLQALKAYYGRIFRDDSSVNAATYDRHAGPILCVDPTFLGQSARQHRCGMTEAIRHKHLAAGSEADPKPRLKLLAVNCFYANTTHAVTGPTEYEAASA